MSRTNKVTATGILYAGIEKDGNNSGSLIITSEDNGVLNATGKYDAAGIGGGFHENGSDITISGGKVIAKSTNQTQPGSAIGKGINGSDQSGNSITPSSTNAVNVWQDTDNENDSKAYSSYTSTLDISTWTNSILMIIFDKPNVDSSDSSPSYHASCNHHYE